MSKNILKIKRNGYEFNINLCEESDSPTLKIVSVEIKGNGIDRIEKTKRYFEEV